MNLFKSIFNKYNKEDGAYTQSNIERFIKAQDRDYKIALNEVRSGSKRSHWTW